jgi:hypothetical protein
MLEVKPAGISPLESNVCKEHTFLFEVTVFLLSFHIAFGQYLGLKFRRSFVGRYKEIEPTV